MATPVDEIVIGKDRLTGRRSRDRLTGRRIYMTPVDEGLLLRPVDSCAVVDDAG